MLKVVARPCRGYLVSLRAVFLRWLERSAAATATGSIGVLQAESRTGEIIRVVERGAAQKRDTFVINHDMYAFLFVNLVIIACFIERHSVLQAGTAAFLYENTQSFSHVSILLYEGVELLDGRFSKANHHQQKLRHVPRTVERESHKTASRFIARVF
jgi:hypothetical protein